MWAYVSFIIHHVNHHGLHINVQSINVNDNMDGKEVNEITNLLIIISKYLFDTIGEDTLLKYIYRNISKISILTISIKNESCYHFL